MNIKLKNQTIQTVPFQPLDENQEHFTGSEIITADEILDQARYIISKRMERGPQFRDVHAAKEYALIHCADHERETVSALFLDGHFKLIIHKEMFRGTVDSAVVYPREIVKDALMHNASMVILCHNHTVDDVQPSKSDKTMTKIVDEALEIVGIRLLDHLIVGKDDVFSFTHDKERTS